jgi:hypothetical protein
MITETIFPQTVEVINTERSVTIPSGTRGLEIKNKSNVPLRVSFLSGVVASSDTGTIFGSLSVFVIAPKDHKNFGEVDFDAVGTLYYASSLLRGLDRPAPQNRIVERHEKCRDDLRCVARLKQNGRVNVDVIVHSDHRQSLVFPTLAVQ